MSGDASGWLVPFPLVVPLATALVCALAVGRPRVQAVTSLTGSMAHAAACLVLLGPVEAEGVVRTVAGGWDAPFGIELAIDRVGLTFLLITAVMGPAWHIVQWSGVDPAPATPLLPPLVHSFLAGASGVFLTADLFNLYVWFEVVLVSSLGLLALGAGLRHLDAALTYFALNVSGTLFVLMGVALIYATTGHLNFAAVASAASRLDAHAVPVVTVMTFGFLVKAAGFPLFAWLPATYHTLPAPVLALFAALGTKVGIYALLRTQAGVLHPSSGLTGDVLGWLAAATMIAGVLGAAHHWDVRRILAFHSVSQAGYMLLGIALGTPAGAQGTLVFAVHHSLVKANLFLIGALMAHTSGSYDLRRSGGLAASHPWLAALFGVQALALVGIPPLSGFWAKLLVIRESLVSAHTAWAVCALGVGALTLYSMLKIWTEGFWKAHPGQAHAAAVGARLGPAAAVSAVLAAASLGLGIWPEPLLRFTSAAAAHLYGRP